MKINVSIEIDDDNTDNRTYQYETIIDHLERTESSCGESLVARGIAKTKDEAKTAMIDELTNLEQQASLAKSILGEL